MKGAHRGSDIRAKISSDGSPIPGAQKVKTSIVYSLHQNRCSPHLTASFNSYFEAFVVVQINQYISFIYIYMQSEVKPI